MNPLKREARRIGATGSIPDISKKVFSLFDTDIVIVFGFRYKIFKSNTVPSRPENKIIKLFKNTPSIAL